MDVPRAERFETAARAAAAQRAVGQNGHVPDLARAVVDAVDEFAAHDDAAADAGRDGYVDEMLEPSARAVAVLAERGRVGVVVEQHGHAEALFEQRDDGELVPARKVRRREYQTPRAVERAAAPDAYGREPRAGFSSILSISPKARSRIAVGRLRRAWGSASPR
jgi:hypothetical protein